MPRVCHLPVCESDLANLPAPSPEGNTRANANGSAGIGDRIVKLRGANRPDEVEVGRDGYIEAPVDDSASWADLARENAKVKYLLRNWIPYKMLTGLVGDSKVGKSMFLLWAVVRPIITGTDWFTGQTGAEPGRVVWCDTERRAAINLERAVRWGLPVERIITPFQDKYQMFDMKDAEHIRRLMDVVCRYKASVVIVDSFRGAHRGNENDSAMDAALKDLGRVCEETSTACIIIHHTKKTRIEGEEAGGEPTLHCARGSSAFLAAVTCQLVIDIPDPRPNLKEAWRRLQVLGENLGVAPKPVGFRITDAGLDFGAVPRKAAPEKKSTEKDRAEQFLLSMLKPGEWHPAAPVLEEAGQQGISEDALHRAKTALGIVKPDYLEKRRDGWWWKLPAGKIAAVP